ncbi:hypothetical protein LTR37_014859 [Vermiconidia calcicola]|uniref:Uncharacterized protein n=1 Tax=Vermiconidia calcicola TaxID=1690605 RepID=A0ACC3MT38_9PEZI|nr:hypothetical protein LTR37_014859 [Vermiconidia calcicola]
MNTKASVAYGWGILCLAGGGAYYFAKRSINADREERAMAEENRRQQRERQRITHSVSRDAKLHDGAPLGKKARAPNAEKSGHKDPAPGDLTHGKPGGESVDPAPVDHAADDESKFEAKVPFRSKKGDRFS